MMFWHLCSLVAFAMMKRAPPERVAFSTELEEYHVSDGRLGLCGCRWQAEEAVDRVQQELKSHVDRQELAAAKVQQYKMRVKEWDMQNRAPPPRKKDEEFPNMPSFEVPAHLREYTGDPDDSKAIRAHRKELQVTNLFPLSLFVKKGVQQ